MSKSGARSDHVIAATFSSDAAEVRDARYKPTLYASPAIYSIGDRYYATGKTKPTAEVGGPWERHPDQFFAERAGTVLWFCEAGGDERSADER